MATTPEGPARRLVRQLPTVAVAAVMAAVSAFVAYFALMGALRLVVGAP